MKNFDFKGREQILGLIDRADDSQETLDLISHFNVLKTQRKPMFLDKSDFENILKWKLRNQFGRQLNLRQLNTDEIIRKITKLVFEIEHSSDNYETELKLRILTSIKGVEIPIASAILTLTNPDKYAVIDFRVWRQLFGIRKSYYTMTDYLKYLGVIKELSIKYDLKLQQIDMAIWQYDIEQNG
jgi:thermostable 8-oxoguanine DNA glycosylase